MHWIAFASLVLLVSMHCGAGRTPKSKTIVSTSCDDITCDSDRGQECQVVEDTRTRNSLPVAFAQCVIRCDDARCDAGQTCVQKLGRRGTPKKPRCVDTLGTGSGSGLGPSSGSGFGDVVTVEKSGTKSSGSKTRTADFNCSALIDALESGAFTSSVEECVDNLEAVFRAFRLKRKEQRRCEAACEDVNSGAAPEESSTKFRCADVLTLDPSIFSLQCQEGVRMLGLKKKEKEACVESCNELFPAPA